VARQTTLLGMLPPKDKDKQDSRPKKAAGPSGPTPAASEDIGGSSQLTDVAMSDVSTLVQDSQCESPLGSTKGEETQPTEVGQLQTLQVISLIRLTGNPARRIMLCAHPFSHLSAIDIALILYLYSVNVFCLSFNSDDMDDLISGCHSGVARVNTFWTSDLDSALKSLCLESGGMSDSKNPQVYL
jgi:hypothetical protein